MLVLCLNVWWFTTGQGSGEPEKSLGGPAPAFTLPLWERPDTEPAGEATVSLADLEGKVVLIDFWATYCGPCKRQMPVLERLHSTMDPEKFAVLSVNIDKGRNQEKLVASYIKKAGYTFPIALDDGKTRRAFKVKSIPTMVLVSPKGEVGFVHTGLMSERRLRKKITALMGDDA